MTRPCKSAKVLTECSQTKSEIAARIKKEDELKGGVDKISPPTYLSTQQIKIFKYIVKELKASDILGNLDIYILSTCAIAIDRLQVIETRINCNFENVLDKDLMSAKDKYMKDLFRCTNELSLSPQSRSKLGNINLKAEQDNIDPVLKALRGGK